MLLYKLYRTEAPPLFPYILLQKVVLIKYTYEKLIIMGSGGTRKNNDVVRINRPLSTKGSEGGGAGVQDINLLCPMAFEVRIKPRIGFPNGTPVSLKQEKEIFISGEYIMDLPIKYQRVIKECGQNGIRYSGKVVSRGAGKTYARFEQIR